ncbi:MAG: 3'-5' exonuclease [Cyclobacterium sp.]|uniref:3'-5' exonuclease n=1 Tax=unclassified Cyclobacterium TaxID=2615055 RepID=UPI0013D24D69|nr:3'-5' exonuclease [Cyclobacterium sp. SYSU L10401]
MTMLKSYRSTFEITEFTKRISARVAVEPIERHGKLPEVKKFQGEDGEIRYLREVVNCFDKGEYNSLGIICKTQEQADRIYAYLKEEDGAISLLDASSVAFAGGKVITTAHLAKGLEFDQVLVTFVNQKNYRSEPDRQMLYVACTRAMHELELTYSQSISPSLID